MQPFVQVDRMKALILDDEPGFRSHLSHFLRRRGYSTAEASCASDARAIWSSGPFDMLIVDVRLAGHPDGLEFAEWARTQCDRSRIIVITGYDSKESRERSQRVGAIAYIEKPFEFHALESHLVVSDEGSPTVSVRSVAESSSMSSFAWATINRQGEILMASPAGREAMLHLAAPDAPDANVRFDATVLKTCLEALGPLGVGTFDGFRRDGTASHYVIVARTDDLDDNVIHMMFLDVREYPSLDHDRSWNEFLARDKE